MTTRIPPAPAGGPQAAAQRGASRYASAAAIPGEPTHSVAPVRGRPRPARRVRPVSRRQASPRSRWRTGQDRQHRWRAGCTGSRHRRSPTRDTAHELNAADGRAPGRGKGRGEDEPPAPARPERRFQLDPDMSAQRRVHRLVENVTRGELRGKARDPLSRPERPEPSASHCRRRRRRSFAGATAAGRSSRHGPHDEGRSPVRSAGQVVGENPDANIHWFAWPNHAAFTLPEKR